jgi:hypothetical protein
MHRVTFLLLVTTVAACANDNPGDPDPNDELATAAIRVLHTVTNVPSVDVIVDGNVVLTALAAGSASAFIPVADGDRSVAFRATGTSGTVAAHTLTFAVGDSITVLTIDSATVLNPWVLTDTGGVVPANRSKVRALHFAENAPPIDIWRTQPDWQTPITFMFPHGYREITPYMESDPGDWTVGVSTLERAGGVPVLGDTLLMTGNIAVPAGESRTVIVFDAPGGGLTFQVITP